SKMEEVIFQGSSARRPVNLAEVSLHFENDDGSLPVAFREVVITRRLSRSGEGEYFINRVPARLRDIADMLRGTGLGGDTGVVIRRRLIAALPRVRPADPAGWLREGAAVGPYGVGGGPPGRRPGETPVDLQRPDDLTG